MKSFSITKNASFFVLTIVAIAAVFIPAMPNVVSGNFNAADVAWILVVTALVFLMTPGLAFFMVAWYIVKM